MTQKRLSNSCNWVFSLSILWYRKLAEVFQKLIEFTLEKLEFPKNIGWKNGKIFKNKTLCTTLGVIRSHKQRFCYALELSFKVTVYLVISFVLSLASHVKF
jgi:hypothetical protein